MGSIQWPTPILEATFPVLCIDTVTENRLESRLPSQRNMVDNAVTLLKEWACTADWLGRLLSLIDHTVNSMYVNTQGKVMIRLRTLFLISVESNGMCRQACKVGLWA